MKNKTEIQMEKGCKRFVNGTYVGQDLIVSVPGYAVTVEQDVNPKNNRLYIPGRMTFGYGRAGASDAIDAQIQELQNQIAVLKEAKRQMKVAAGGEES